MPWFNSSWENTAPIWTPLPLTALPAIWTLLHSIKPLFSLCTTTVWFNVWVCHCITFQLCHMVEKNLCNICIIFGGFYLIFMSVQKNWENNTCSLNLRWFFYCYFQIFCNIFIVKKILLCKGSVHLKLHCSHVVKRLIKWFKTLNNQCVESIPFSSQDRSVISQCRSSYTRAHMSV